MDIVAHGLWAAAASITAKRTGGVKLRVGWTVWWAVFPDMAAFGPTIALGIWLKLTGRLDAYGGHVPHVNFGFPTYTAVHSLIIFLAVFGIASLLARRIILEMLGWLLHILIDIPTHSFSYYATRFLWPVSGTRIDGLAWWTPWFWISTYAALAVVYTVLWHKGWISFKAKKNRAR